MDAKSTANFLRGSLTLPSCVALLACALAASAQAGIVNISSSSALGTPNVLSQNDFLGILTNTSPTQIGAQNVNFNNVPAGESFAVGDLVGRDADAPVGGLFWEYVLTLPGDAVPGTGLFNIAFAGRAFERSTNNLEGSDGLSWGLYLNGNPAPVATTGPALGSDWTTFAVGLSDPGGATITQARVVVTITGFNVPSEWFATRGTLSADYAAIPEPPAIAILLFLGLVWGSRARASRRGVATEN